MEYKVRVLAVCQILADSFKMNVAALALLFQLGGPITLPSFLLSCGGVHEVNVNLAARLDIEVVQHLLQLVVPSKLLRRVTMALLCRYWCRKVVCHAKL